MDKYMKCGFVLLQLFCIAQATLPDWLISKPGIPSHIENPDQWSIRLTNGLIARDFLIDPNFFTINFYSFEREKYILRAISPETVINIDGTLYNVGGILTSIPRGYLNRTALAQDMNADPKAFRFHSYYISSPEARFKYTPRRFAPANTEWPPRGLRLNVNFIAPTSAPATHQQVMVTVHYEIYDNIPLLAKWVTITNKSPNPLPVFVNSIERLAVNWEWSTQGYGWLHVENDVPWTGARVNWFDDQGSDHMSGGFQNNVECVYAENALVEITEAEPFESFRVHLLVVGSSDPERFGLAVRKKMRLLAPQTQESPIFFHLTQIDSQTVRFVLDQMADVGFEMLIYSFWTGFNLETDNDTFIQKVASDTQYANSKGIEVGGYDLIAADRADVAKEWLALENNPPDSACFASGWYDYLLNKVLTFIDRTGISMLETDGPWTGYHCNSTTHSHHHNRADSIYWQLTYTAKFFRILRELEVFINQPDQYFYHGGNKGVLGYAEAQFSLPRWQDLSISRQTMFDFTYHASPTSGWMLLPMVNYNGGGPAAWFEPLSDHIKEYDFALAQYFGAGVMACYRGDKLYDSSETRAVVIKWVSFYKQYRDILTSDIIHVRRADMQGIDCLLHVNPELKVKGLAMMYNPTNEAQQLKLSLPLYYTGLTEKAVVSHEGATPVEYDLDRFSKIMIDVQLEALSATWYTIM